MKHLGIEVPVKNVPGLNPGFLPLGKFCIAFLKDAKEPLDITMEQAEGEVAIYKASIHGTPDMVEAGIYYVDRIVKVLLWTKSGFRAYLNGGQAIYEAVKATYYIGGARAFDADFMFSVYGKPLEVMYCDQVLAEKGSPQTVDRHLDGRRIGFDAGGSDHKMSAVIDDESVFSEEVVWPPKTASGSSYHYEGIVPALRAAAKHMPWVGAMGVSSTGIYIKNRTMNASPFLKVSKEGFDTRAEDIYIRVIRDILGNVPYVMANDGDVSALAGAMSLGENSILDIVMDTSEAVGYVNSDGYIIGWLNELALALVDVSPNVMEDERSGNIGCSAKYSSQDPVIKLVPAADTSLSADFFPTEKPKEAQELMNQGGSPAEVIYRSIGVYLGYSLVPCHHSYGFKYVLLLGRVVSGRGDDITPDTCKKVLTDEYPEMVGLTNPTLPDEKTRRVGQSVAAVSLPESG